MSRLSFRPRPVDIHKKLPIVKSIRDLDNEDAAPGVSRTVQHGHLALDSENELVLATPTRRGGAEIPTPQFVSVDSYEKDYTQTFTQPPSYLRSRGARNEGFEFVEYDLDDEDDDWLDKLNIQRKILPHERFEQMLYKMELSDHKLRERAGGMPTTLGYPMPVLLQREAAIDMFRGQQHNRVLGAVYDFWKAKRERWEKPILRRLQPPPPVNDTNPFNVFRPREKVHRPHTRRMQRRENDVQSFNKLREVRRNLEQARDVMLALQKREEKKREVAECEAHIQRLQIMYKHECKLDDETLFNNIPSPLQRKVMFPSKDEQMNGGDMFDFATPIMENSDRMDQLRRKRKKRIPNARGRPPKRIQAMDNLDPVMLFTKPLEEKYMLEAGITPQFEESASPPFKGRMGRGGRIIFDRWNPLTGASLANVLLTG